MRIVLGAVGAIAVLSFITQTNRPSATNPTQQVASTQQSATITSRPTFFASSTPLVPTATTVPSSFIPMPDVVGLHYSEAASLVQDAGFTFLIDNYRNVCNFDLPRGQIIRQEPPAGEFVSPTATVVLYRASIPNNIVNRYPDIYVNSDSGFIDYGGLLSLGEYSLEVQRYGRILNARLDLVEFIDDQGNLVQSFVPYQLPSGGEAVARTLLITESGCYIFRIHYRAYASPSELAEGVELGSASLYIK